MSEGHIVVETGRNGHGTVKLDGQDISRFVAGITLHVRPGSMPVAEVRIFGSARVVCETAGIEWVEPTVAPAEQP